MVKIPEPKSKTVEAIYAAYEAAADDGLRPHLGASLIGTECEASLFYTFRWATVVRHSGRLLRLFETGQREEERFVANLRRIGVTVMEVDPETGRQWKVSEHGGHFGGSMDGIAIGVLEAPKAYHVTEMKTHSAKSFAELIKSGVEKAKPLHAAQMHTYMYLADVPRALYIAVNKDNDQLYTERLRHDRDMGARLVEKARRVIYAKERPPRVASTPDFYLCRFCDHAGVCWQGDAPPRTCRSCVFSEPVDGGWHCHKHHRDLSVGEQKAGCDDHRFLPTFVPGQQVDAAEDGSWIEYVIEGETWIDGVKS